MTERSRVGVGSSENLSTEDRLSRLKLQDEAAWADLVADVTPLIQFWFDQMAVRVQDRADLLQEVFIRAVATIGGYEGPADGPAFKAWLYAIARSVRIDALRRAGRRLDAVTGPFFLATLARTGATSDVAAEDDNPVRGLNSIRLERAVAILRRQVRPRTFAIFEALMLDGVPSAEVCVRFELRPDSLRMIRLRLVRRLRAIVRDVRVA